MVVVSFMIMEMLTARFYVIYFFPEINSSMKVKKVPHDVKLF